MKYREYKNPDYAALGREVLRYWKKHSVFERSVEQRNSHPAFTFYEGPPSANGTPGIHHVMARTVKDIFCRYKTLRRCQVKRKGGWDTHGLPVELQVEKELGITKEDIGHRISVDEYNRKCREAVMKYKKEWDDLTEIMGFWIDLDDPYITFDRDYMESVWYLLKKIYDKGLLYKGYTIQPYSPAAGTGLSSHELNQPGAYREVKDTSIVAQFKVKNTDRDYFLAWTTTPWTLPANNGLAVGKDIDYVKISTYNPYTHLPVNVILARDRVAAYFDTRGQDLDLDSYGENAKVVPWKIIDTFKGEKLAGLKYEQLLPYVPVPDPAFNVVVGDFVSTEDGTGIVHLAKTFGADDFRVSVQYGMPGIMVKDEFGKETPIVDKQGKFVKEITDFAGMYVKNYDDQDEDDPAYRPTDVLIAIKLKEENKAFRVEKYVHSYPHCWRTDKPVLYYPMDSWFIKTTAVKDELVRLNNTINWKPASTGTGRFGNWLENLVDWNLSRSRFWGTPLPIWRTKDGSEEKCIGSLEELRAEVHRSVEAGHMDAPLPDDFDLHRPFVDDVVLTAGSGAPMFREPDLIDVWFDSGAMPYAQLHYPFENREVFEQSFPADFIAEGVDQTRGWFFTLHTIAALVHGSVAFRNVIANGLVLDKDGNKMSKRLGNAIDPFATIDKYGPDATRWYMISNSNPWDNLKFDLAGVAELQRRFFGTLHNTYSFFALYANLDKFDHHAPLIPLDRRPEIDRWIISRLHTLISFAQKSYDDYEPTKVARAIQDFVIDDLSNWYVRLNRKRFWVGSMTDDKMAAYQTLHSCLRTVALLASPLAPFYMDRLFLDLTASAGEPEGQSVHLEDFPEAEPRYVDEDLETRMELAQQISSLVHSLRKQHKIKVRQPLKKIMLPVLSKKTQEQIEAVGDVIRSEVNIKEIVFVDNTSGVIVKKAKPNFRKLGQQYGPKMKSISAAVADLSQEEIARYESAGAIVLETEDGPVALQDDDLLIQSEDIPGWTVASEGGLTVALDISITEPLRMEGLARELVNRIQNMRKDMGLDVQDKIAVQIETVDGEMQRAIDGNKNYICTETQALRLEPWKGLDAPEIQVDTHTLKIKLEVAKLQQQ